MDQADEKFAYHALVLSENSSIVAIFDDRRGHDAFCAAESCATVIPAEVAAGCILSPNAPQGFSLSSGPTAPLKYELAFTPSSTSVRSMKIFVLSTAPGFREDPGTGCCIAHESLPTPPEGIRMPLTFLVPNHPCFPEYRTE